MKFDLHIHSTFSDGEYTPLELLKLCHDRQLSTIAITDHNNLFGSKEAIENNPYKDITVISGIELTAKSPSDINLHILGYNIDLENDKLNYVCKEIMIDNIRRIESLLFHLKKEYNITFKEDDIDELFSSDGNIGRPDVAKLCLKYGYVKSVEDAFKYLFKPLRDKLVKKMFELTAKECIKCILDADGIPSLAHPVSLKRDLDSLRVYIEDLANAGLDAVEVYHSNNPEDLTEGLLKITKDLNLYQSIGSDYHGPIIKPNIKLGSGINSNLLNKHPSIIDKLLEVKRYD